MAHHQIDVFLADIGRQCLSGGSQIAQAPAGCLLHPLLAVAVSVENDTAVLPEVVSDDQMVLIAHDIAQRIENELEYPGQIKVNMVRESRVVDYAK